MRRTKDPPTDPHLRFEAWLLAGETDEPPRDLALHASVCAGCGRMVAAYDLLGDIDVGRASLPVLREPLRRPRRAIGRAWRFALTAGVAMLVSLAIGFGAGQVIELPGAGQQQDVLGGTGRPEASATASPSPTPTSSASAAPP